MSIAGSVNIYAHTSPGRIYIPLNAWSICNKIPLKTLVSIRSCGEKESDIFAGGRHQAISAFQLLYNTIEPRALYLLAEIIPCVTHCDTRLRQMVVSVLIESVMKWRGR